MVKQENSGNTKLLICNALNSQKLHTLPQGLQHYSSLFFVVADLKIDDFENSNLRKIKYSVSFRIDVFDKQRQILVWSRVYSSRSNSEYWNVVISKKTKKLKKMPSINEILESS